MDFCGQAVILLSQQTEPILVLGRVPLAPPLPPPNSSVSSSYFWVTQSSASPSTYPQKQVKFEGYNVASGDGLWGARA